jgi:long-chain acyl-CoA synthetase
MILSQALNNAALKNPGAPAILDLGKTLSFSDMRKKISQLSYLFQAEIGHGNRVAFISQNNQALALCFFAFSNTGNPVILLDPADSDEELAKALRDLEVNQVCVSGDQLSRVNDLLRIKNISAGVIEIEKKKGGEYDTSYSPPPDHPLKESDPALILRQEEFGSDTKYIFFTHKQIYAAASGVRKFYHFGGNDRLLTTMSWAHPFALIHGLLAPLLAGSCCAVNPQSPSNEEFLDYISKQKINRFADSPKALYWLLSISKAAKFTLPGVRSVTAGAGKLSPALRKTFSMLKIPALQSYGRVEALWTIAMEDSEKAKELMRLELLPGFKCKVLNEAGDEITGASKREGPLAITGDSVMSSFFHKDKKVAEKATKQTIRGTWFYTGEAARLEGEAEELSILPLGALEDVIQNNRNFLSPDRIDAFCRELPDVLDAAGFVRRDERGLPRFAVAVVKQGKSLSESQVLSHLGTKLSSAECPQTVHFIDAIPRNRHDEIDRAALGRQLSVG